MSDPGTVVTLFLTVFSVGIGVGSTTLGFGWSTGYIYFTLARARRVVFGGRLQPWVSGKDIVLELLRRWGAQQSQGMSVELVDAERQLPIAYRNTIANMMAEAEALNGIFAPDEITYEWYRRKGITELPYPPFAPGADAVYEQFFRYGMRDFRSIGHKAIYVANSFRTLDCIGWHHAEPVLRSLAYALLKHEGGNPADGETRVGTLTSASPPGRCWRP